MADDEEGEEAAAPAVDLTDSTAQRRRRQKHDDAEKERAAVLTAILATPAGRRWYAYLLHDVCGLYRPVANAAFDAQALHYREGARAVGQHLHEMALRHSRQPYIVLLAENLNQG